MQEVANTEVEGLHGTAEEEGKFRGKLMEFDTNMRQVSFNAADTLARMVIQFSGKQVFAITFLLLARNIRSYLMF